MSRCLLVTFAFLIVGGIPSAAAILPCASGTLTSYIALGTAGCSVGTLQFGGFEALAPEPGSTSIPTGNVTVASISTGLSFTYNQVAMNAAFLDSVFGFNVNSLVGGTITGEILTLSGSSATGFGGVAGIGLSCIGAVSATGSCSSSAARNLGVDDIFGLIQSTDQVSYIGLPVLGQKLDLSVQSTGSDMATLGSAALTFTSAAAPEPSTIYLAVGCLALVLLRRGKVAV